ncbi:nitroreductase family deazaflavin-dependent oxidoreductase [Oscillochloris sp. ZM17-4]|uniref:nitroreductase family deazaflavin-dependent oxidoreductase n=1 Tax=Oscillochloris sp. ZM17-4 TaxID=2866714 RepID=UPI001C72A062|nr:nitroreductase family deazaflavin-dependent oxidoreductase [Oscillochloris sp. ZM17-4]MBX0329460.1 nitroreductase family deazaflavin-dependent oxidoreductase [Oscillochloris sp. ZM17-4]
MSTPRDRIERALRQGFRLLNRLMVLLWRLGLGPSLSLTPTITGRYLVLTHTGRKSGLPRRTPLNYAWIDGTIYVTAGFGPVSDWYRNLLAHPQVEIWLPDGRRAARAEELPDSHPQRLALLREVLKGSGFATMLAGINPYTFSDARLARASRFYRLIAITPGEELRGPGGPGDLAWVWWPVAGGALAISALARRLRLSRVDRPGI